MVYTKEHLFIQSPEWAYERVFLGALILANKVSTWFRSHSRDTNTGAQYVNDWSIKSYHWALCSGVFGRRDIGCIEHEFFDVLDWDLSVTGIDILSYYDRISPFPSKPKLIPVPVTASAEDDVDTLG